MSRPVPSGLTIAIDGPAGSGKSTLGAALAERLGYTYFDSGVMYRALAWLALQRGVDPQEETALVKLAEAADIQVTRPSQDDGRQATVLVDGTDVTWAIRRAGDRVQNLFGGGIDDALPARGALGARVQRLVESGRLRLVTGVRIAKLVQSDAGIVVSGLDSVLPPVVEIIAATGFRPDFEPLSELRLGLDPAVESPTALAPLIDPNIHSCGTAPPHGAEELKHPETDFYIAGMKSYGRAPTFLMMTGYEQVRSIAAAIAGDWDAAREVQLVLPETGVCSSSSVLAARGVSCCGPAASAVEVDAASCCGGTQPDSAAADIASSCCGDSVPQVIQLAAVGKGGCCQGT